MASKDPFESPSQASPTHPYYRKGRKKAKQNKQGLQQLKRGGVLGRDNLDSSKHGSPRLGVRGEGSSPGANAYGAAGVAHGTTGQGMAMGKTG